MDISFAAFWGQVTSNPMLMVSVILTLAVIFVNGWTDAPNAIATCVTTRCMEANQRFCWLLYSISWVCQS